MTIFWGGLSHSKCHPCILCYLWHWVITELTVSRVILKLFKMHSYFEHLQMGSSDGWLWSNLNIFTTAKVALAFWHGGSRQFREIQSLDPWNQKYRQAEVVQDRRGSCLRLVVSWMKSVVKRSYLWWTTQVTEKSSCRRWRKPLNTDSTSSTILMSLTTYSQYFQGCWTLKGW